MAKSPSQPWDGQPCIVDPYLSEDQQAQCNVVPCKAMPSSCKASLAKPDPAGIPAPMFADVAMEHAGMSANDKVNLKPCLKYKFIPNPKNAAEVRLRSVLDKHNVREERRRARKRAAASSLNS